MSRDYFFKNYFFLGALTALFFALVVGATLLGTTIINYITWPNVIPVGIGILGVLAVAWRLDRKNPWHNRFFIDAIVKTIAVFTFGAAIGCFAMVINITVFPQDLMSWSNPDGVSHVFVSHVLVPFAWLLSVGIPSCFLLGPAWYFVGWLFERRHKKRQA